MDAATKRLTPARSSRPVDGAQCGLHCVAAAVAMLGLMLYRRADYSGAATWT
jgi:hypothetical protein